MVCFLLCKKRAIIPVLICPSTLGVRTSSSVCLGFSTDFFLKSHDPFERPSCSKLQKQILSAVSKRLFFGGVSKSFYPPLRVGKTLRLSNGTPWERQLWILLRGGGRKWIVFTLSQVSWKVSHHRWGGGTLPEINGSDMKRWHPKKGKDRLPPINFQGQTR